MKLFKQYLVMFGLLAVISCSVVEMAHAARYYSRGYYYEPYGDDYYDDYDGDYYDDGYYYDDSGRRARGVLGGAATGAVVGGLAGGGRGAGYGALAGGLFGGLASGL